MKLLLAVVMAFVVAESNCQSDSNPPAEQLQCLRAAAENNPEFTANCPSGMSISAVDLTAVCNDADCRKEIEKLFKTCGLDFARSKLLHAVAYSKGGL